MLESLGTILADLCAIVLVGALIVAYVVWRSRRQMDDAAAEQAARAGGPGKPTGPV